MKIIVNNLAIEYQDEGSGPAILLLHGWQDTLHTFDILSSHLQGYRLIRLDLPGFGQSEEPPSSWSIEDYAFFIKNFLKKINISEIEVLVGHSFGGRIAIILAGEKLIPLRKLALIASGGIAKTKKWHNIAYAGLAKVGKASLFLFPHLQKHARDRLYRKTGSDYQAAGSLRPVFLRIIQKNLRKTAQRISIPTLLLWGAKDTETPLIDGKTFAICIPDSRLEVYPEGSHYVHQEKPLEIAELLKSF